MADLKKRHFRDSKKKKNAVYSMKNSIRTNLMEKPKNR